MKALSFLLFLSEFLRKKLRVNTYVLNYSTTAVMNIFETANGKSVCEGFIKAGSPFCAFAATCNFQGLSLLHVGQEQCKLTELGKPRRFNSIIVFSSPNLIYMSSISENQGRKVSPG